jgi:hypothetical protein
MDDTSTEVELASGCDYDHSPLRDALKAGKLREADEILRDSLIDLAGEAAQARGYVYFTDVKRIPVEDMKTLDNLWKAYSNGNFGFSVQKRLWLLSNKQWTPFFRRIDWVRGEEDSYVRWTGLEQSGNEFIYNATTAQRGHLPLTSCLRGTQLFEAIMSHPAFDDVEVAKLR